MNKITNAKTNLKSIIPMILVLALVNIPFYMFGQITLEKHEQMESNGLYFWYSDQSKPGALLNIHYS